MISGSSPGRCTATAAVTVGDSCTMTEKAAPCSRALATSWSVCCPVRAVARGHEVRAGGDQRVDGGALIVGRGLHDGLLIGHGLRPFVCSCSPCCSRQRSRACHSSIATAALSLGMGCCAVRHAVISSASSLLQVNILRVPLVRSIATTAIVIAHAGTG
jgi:hypothetical protein